MSTIKAIDDTLVPAVDMATFKQVTISSWIGVEKALLSVMVKKPDAPKPDSFGRYKLRDLATYVLNHFRFRNREKNRDVDEIKREKLGIERDLKAAELDRVRGDNMPVSEHNRLMDKLVQEQRRKTEAAMRSLTPLVAGRKQEDVARIIADKIAGLFQALGEGVELEAGKEVKRAEKKNTRRAKND